MSMLRLCTLDPSKYGWTAIGGISTNLLVPHEMARRPEARDKFLKQEKKNAAASSAAAASDPISNDGSMDASSKYYTIMDPSSMASSSSTSGAAKSTTTTATAAHSGFASANNDSNQGVDDIVATNQSTPNNNALKEIVIHATATTTAIASIDTTKDADNPDKKGQLTSKPSSSVTTESSLATAATASSTAATTAATSTTNNTTKTKLDIYTYHRGRVGQEPRNPSTGTLLCDMDPIDTNYGWIPCKNAVCKVTINFPLGDLNEDDDDDDEEDSEKEAETKSGSRDENTGGGGLDGGEFTKSDNRRRGDIDVSGGISERNVRASRNRSFAGDGPATYPSSISAKALSSTTTTALNHPQLPHFVQVVDWDLANPHTPTPEVYATTIASEFGLSFPQTMDLIESIERQLRAFCASQPIFYAPMAILDPYGCERPDVHFGPPEIYCGPVLGSAAAAGGGGGGGGGVGSRSYVIRRSNSNQFSSGGGGGSSSTSRRGGGGGGGPAAPRPPSSGVIKLDKRGIQVVPKDQLVQPNKDGDVYIAEVLKRANSRSTAMVMECVKKVEASLTTTMNEVCHICHNRKACGLTFHCGVHNYCDFHCATRLGFRVGDYDSTQPTNLPINFCPVCTLICLCARCTRRLVDKAKSLQKECQKQNVGPEDADMENVNDLCSFKLKHADNVTSNPPSSIASVPQRISKDKGSSKKVKHEQIKESKGDGMNNKRRQSSGSVDIDDDDDAVEGARKSSSRSMRSSPSSDAIVDERPRKKRKSEMPTTFVSVLKVPPSAFPKEMCCGEDLDPSTAEDMNMVFSPDGSFPVDESTVPSLGNSQKYQDLIPPFTTESHFFICAECGRNGGELVLCKVCPRAYHEMCLAKSNSSTAVEDDDGGDATITSSGVRCKQLTSPCKRCECDRKVMDSEMDNVSETKKNESQNYTSIGMILCKLQQILNKLIDYDFGFIFATPVNPNEVIDYHQIITKPMDYGTIISKLETRQYVTTDNNLFKKVSGVELLDAMEKLLLQALLDVLQVHHNCFLYNPKGSNYYRAGKVQERQWDAYFNKLTRRSFPDFVLLQLMRFREDCKDERKRTVRSRHFEANNPEGRQCKPIAVFDPDTKRIVKQYSSKVSARTAAKILSNMGYACETELTSTSTKTRLDHAEDPTKPLFGYQWLRTEKLKSGLFKIKPYFHSDNLKSPTPNNIVILKADAAVGGAQQGFESEEAAYGDWLNEKSKSFTTSSHVDEEESDDTRYDFLMNYLDGHRSINGIVWNRVDNNTMGIAVAPKLPPKSTGKVVMEEEHAPKSPMRKKESKEY